MKHLIHSIKNTVEASKPRPFSVYTSKYEQRIFNVPMIKPLFICVLDGEKRLGQTADTVCSSGNFIFLSNSPKIDMRNIPSEREYLALLIEFEYEDFAIFSEKVVTHDTFFMGTIDESLEKTLVQLSEWSRFAPQALWPTRRRELLLLLHHLGHHQVSSIAEATGVSHKVHHLISADFNQDLSVADLCDSLAMSESTLRRKLQAEGTTLQAIKDQAKLGYGLHLLQTTQDTIALIASHCGYQSQSRFTDRFKQRFGLTPTELRKTQMTD